MAAPTKARIETRDAPGGSTTGTVARTARLLTALAEANGDATVNGLAEKLQLAPSTIHRLLDLLAGEGFVEHDPDLRRYRVGRAFYRSASLVLEKFDLKRLAMPSLQRLVQASGETAILSLYEPSSQSMFFALSLQSPNALGYLVELNRPHPLVWGATSKAILARLDDEAIVEVLRRSRPSPASGTKVPAAATLMREVEQIRQRGYAVSRGQKMKGASAIAAPFFDRRGRVAGSVGLTVPEFRMDEALERRLAPLIIAEARELSHLGLA